MKQMVQQNKMYDMVVNLQYEAAKKYIYDHLIMVDDKPQNALISPNDALKACKIALNHEID